MPRRIATGDEDVPLRTGRYRPGASLGDTTVEHATRRHRRVHRSLVTDPGASGMNGAGALLREAREKVHRELLHLALQTGADGRIERLPARLFLRAHLGAA